MIKKLTLAAALMLSLTATSHAAIVDVFITGDIGLIYGTDDFSLDGTVLSVTFSYDTTSSNVGTGMLSGPGTQYAIYDTTPAGVTFEFIDPNGPSLVALESHNGNGFLTTNNNPPASGNPDNFSTAGGSFLSTELLGLS